MSPASSQVPAARAVAPAFSRCQASAATCSSCARTPVRYSSQSASAWWYFLPTVVETSFSSDSRSRLCLKTNSFSPGNVESGIGSR